MPRFNQKRWTPAKDSSAGCATLDRTRVVLHVPPPMGFVGDASTPERPACPCGCAEYPKGKKATFAMGHDAKLRGKLIRAHLTDTQIVIVEDVAGTHKLGPFTAMSIAEEHGWEKYLVEAEVRRDEKNKEVLRRALGSKKLIRVGRWEYTGQVAAVYSTADGNKLEIEYVTKSGEIKKRIVMADEAEEVEG